MERDVTSIFLIGDSNIQTLVFLHRLSIFLIGYEHLCAIKSLNTQGEASVR